MKFLAAEKKVAGSRETENHGDYLAKGTLGTQKRRPPHSALTNQGRLHGRGDAHTGPKGQPTLLVGSLCNQWKEMREPLSSETLWRGTPKFLRDHKPLLLPLLFASVVTSPLSTHLHRSP